MAHLTIGELLRRHRIEAQLNQKDIAELTAYDHTTVSRLERNERQPTVDYIVKFASALHLADEDQEELLRTFRQQTPIGEIDEYSFSKQPVKSWGRAPDTKNFKGRTQERSFLKSLITEKRCRLIMLTGIGGMGKTLLATQVAQDVEEDFQYIVWRTLVNAPPLNEVLFDCLQVLSDYTEPAASSNAPDLMIQRLIEILKQKRCLLVLDNYESILESGKAGYYKVGYEKYGLFLTSVGDIQHQSCILLTSREKSLEISRLEAEDAPVRSYQLTGIDPIVGRAIMNGKSLEGTESDWETLVHQYSGNPLALTLVAEMIREVYSGDIQKFLEDAEVIFGEVENVVQEQFHRLSSLEQSILLWLGVERESVSQENLYANLFPVPPKRDFLIALQSLRRRSLVEVSSAGFTLQNVIMEYVTTYLVEQIYQEIINEEVSLLASHALTKAQAKEYIRETQVRLLLRPLIDKLVADLGIQNVKEKFIGILDMLRNGPSTKSGYAAGNILNLILQLSGDMKIYNFSGLTIWQAYLSNTNLQDVDFSFSTFKECKFTEQFSDVLTLRFSPNDEFIAIGGIDNTIHLWSLNNSRPINSYSGHTSWIRTLKFSPNGEYIASGSDDHTIRLWDVKSGHCLKVLQDHTGWVRSVDFNFDGGTLASGGGDETVRLWDVQSGRCIKKLRGHKGQIWSVAFSPQGNLLASCGDDQNVRLWDVNSEQCILLLEGHTKRIRSLVFTPDGEYLASGSDDHTVRLWDVKSGSCVAILQGHTDRVRTVGVSPDGKILASGSSDQTVRLWDIQSGKCKRILHGHDNRVWSVTFNCSGSILASGSSDQTVCLWDSYTGKCIHRLNGFTTWIGSVSFDESGMMLASGGDDNTVRLWDIQSGQCVRILQGHTSWVRAVSFCCKANLLVSASEDQTIRLWDISSGQCKKVLRGHTNRVWSVASSPDGSTIASCGEDQTVRLWDVPSGRCNRVLRGHTNRIWSVAFSPDGSTIATSSDDQTVRLWDAYNGECTAVLSGHTKTVWSVSFSRDGNVLASCSDDQTVRLWNSHTHECLNVIQGDTYRFRSVAFSPTEDVLVTASEEQNVRLWDTLTGDCQQVFYGHNNRVWSVVFSPDGSTIASSGTSVRLWNRSSGNCIQILKASRPYENMKINGCIGLSAPEKAVLMFLGAIGE